MLVEIVVNIMTLIIVYLVQKDIGKAIVILMTCIAQNAQVIVHYVKEYVQILMAHAQKSAQNAKMDTILQAVAHANNATHHAKNAMAKIKTIAFPAMMDFI